MKVNDCDYDKRTALHVAASEGHIEVVRILIKEGADLNFADRYNTTALDGTTSSSPPPFLLLTFLLQRCHPPRTPRRCTSADRKWCEARRRLELRTGPRARSRKRRHAQRHQAGRERNSGVVVRLRSPYSVARRYRRASRAGREVPARTRC